MMTLARVLPKSPLRSEVAKRRPWETDALDQIAQRARGLKAVLSDIVWTVDPRRRYLAELLSKMRQFAFGLLEQEDRRVSFHTPDDNVAQSIAPSPGNATASIALFQRGYSQRRPAFTCHSTLRLSCPLWARSLFLEIRDNGCGFNPIPFRLRPWDQSLAISRRATQRPLSIGDSSGQGVTIRLQVPSPLVPTPYREYLHENVVAAWIMHRFTLSRETMEQPIRVALVEDQVRTRDGLPR